MVNDNAFVHIIGTIFVRMLKSFDHLIHSAFHSLEFGGR